MDQQQKLQRLLQELRQRKLSPEETYHAVATFGKRQFLEALPDVERLLTHEDEDLRNIALIVLGFDWRKQEYWHSVVEVLQLDPDDNNRLTAASVLGSLKKNTRDQLVLQALAEIVHDADENSFVRKSAYYAMKAIIHYDMAEQVISMRKPFDPKRDVDWKVVRSYL